jgi:hypothetical protein
MLLNKLWYKSQYIYIVILCFDRVDHDSRVHKQITVQIEKDVFHSEDMS